MTHLDITSVYVV